MSRRVAAAAIASRLLRCRPSQPLQLPPHLQSATLVRLQWSSSRPSPPSPRSALCQCQRGAILASASDLRRSRHFSITAVAPSPSVSASSPFLSAFSQSSSPQPSAVSHSSPAAASHDGVQLTEAAARRISELRVKYGSALRLRLSVDSGGCSGLSYRFELDRGGKQPDDAEFSRGDGATLLLVDSVSLPLLSGAVVDYSSTIERSGFEVAANPHSVAKCGCGSSFQPKEL